MLDAAVVIVTYNHAATIVACLEHMHQLDPAPAELVVIDNASRDATVDLVRHHFPAVRLIEARANLGFAGGSNFGVRATSASIIVLANPDLLPRADWLEQLVRPFALTAGTGVVGCKLLYPGSQRIQHAGGTILMPLALGTHRGYQETDAGQYDALETVEYVTGAALAARRDVWEKLGGMDEAFYPAYYEEVDFCTRVRQAGWMVLYTPLAVAEHVEGAAIAVHSATYYRLFHLNRLRYIFKHFNDTWLLRVWLPAEMAYIRAVANDTEITTLQAVYLAWQLFFSGHERNPSVHAFDLPADGTAKGEETELQWVIRQIHQKTTIQPQLLTSRWPLLARLRNLALQLTGVVDYLRGVVQDQNDTNRAVAEALVALARQRRAADAAIVLQGLLLAKVLRTQEEQTHEVA